MSPFELILGLATIALCAWELRDEFRSGGSLSFPRPAWREDDLAELFALPLPDGVEEYDVLATLDWIEAL